MKINDLKNDKAVLRQRLQDDRRAIPELHRLSASARITETCLSLDEIRAASHIFIFISYATEVDTHGLIHTLLDAGKTLAVPKIIDKRMIAVQLEDWQQLQPGELGILTPLSSTALMADYDVCITPGLGFTQTGERIGYGAGYYDRWFAEHRVGRKIAIAFEKQIVEQIPTDEHDQRVDCIITERRLIEIGA